MERLLKEAVTSCHRLHPCIQSVNRPSGTSSSLHVKFRRSVLSQQTLQCRVSFKPHGAKTSSSSSAGAKFSANWELVKREGIDDKEYEVLWELVRGLDTCTSALQLLQNAAELLSNTLRYGATQYYEPTTSTRLIAVLGTVHPEDDDWLVADFCLLHQMFGGVAMNEQWLASTSCRLPEVIEATGKDILHGIDTTGTLRRVVFARGDTDFCTYQEPGKLKDSFLALAKEEASEECVGEAIVIIIVSHGSEDGDIALGGTGFEHFTTREELESTLSAAAAGVQISIINTACVSGLWAVDWKKLNQRVQKTAVIAAPISGGNSVIQPTTIPRTPVMVRATCLGDLPKTPAASPVALVALKDFCKKIAIAMRTLPGSAGTKNKGFPACFEADLKVPASFVLGMDDKPAMILKLEGIRNLKPEFTSLALGIGNFKKRGRQRHAEMKSKNAHNDMWFDCALHMWDVIGPTLEGGSPPDKDLLDFYHRLENQRLRDNQECLRAWESMCYRHRLNRLAQDVVKVINPGFTPFAAFHPKHKDADVEPYKKILRIYLRNGVFCRNARLGYRNHGVYVAAAARAADCKPEALEEVLVQALERCSDTDEPKPEETKAALKYGQPKVPERANSHSAVRAPACQVSVWSLNTSECQLLPGSWASVENLNLLSPGR